MGDAGMNAEFRRWNSSTGVWDKIASIDNIDGPNMSREVFDVSPDLEFGYRTFKSGLRNPGTLTVTATFTLDTYETIKTDFETDSAQNYEIVLQDDENTSLEFEGYVTEFPLSIPPGKITFSFTIQITGEPTLESGSGPSPG